MVSVNAGGHVSTGHAALEAAGEPGAEGPLYISHYPAVEIDRSPDNLRVTLRAGPENNVPGRFLPSYRAEADDWCEATVSVVLRGVDRTRLRAFWAAYRRDTTYNLVGRNCSTAVAGALDAAVEGSLDRDGTPWRSLARAVMTPEFWAAALMRNGAGAMTWTPASCSITPARSAPWSIPSRRPPPSPGRACGGASCATGGPRPWRASAGRASTRRMERGRGRCASAVPSPGGRRAPSRPTAETRPR